MKQTIITHGIIRKDQKILLVKNQAGLYELPGGIVEPGIAPRESLKTILWQQIHKDIEAAQLLDVFWHSTDDAEQLVILFLVGLEDTTKISLDQQHSKYVWKGLWELQLDRIDTLTKIALELKKTEAQKEAELDEEKSGNVKNTSIKVAEEVIVYTDGGSRGNPGPSAAGFVILNIAEEVLFEGGKYLGITTNNQAEYQAVKLGLEKAYELGARKVKFRLDSLLIVNQMLGLYQIKNRDLWPIYSSIKELIKKFEEVTFMHVRREFNKEADALVNKVLDEHS